MVSIIIPSYNDPFLKKTIDSLLENAKGKIEIIPVLDGCCPLIPIKKDKRVKTITLLKNSGMRAAINAGLKAARGKYIMKCDSHCIFGPGYDRIMAKNCQENWLMIPRRYHLDDINWKRDESRPPYDYHYLTFPLRTKGYGVCISSQNWLRYQTKARDSKHEIDDTMSFQGSCWFANRKYFLKRVGYLDDSDNSYGPFGGEQIEIGLKYWLGGGENKIIKSTWYAHLLKRPRHYNAKLFMRDYKRNSSTGRRRTWISDHWMNNKEPNMIHPLTWLVEKFWPVPTWPDDRNQWFLPK